MAGAAEAPALVPQILRVSAVDGAQIVQVARSRALLPALVGGQQCLAEPGLLPVLGLVPGPDLLDDVGQGDPESQPVGPDPGGAEDRAALVPDDPGDLRGRLARDQAASTQPAGDDRLAVGLAVPRAEPRRCWPPPDQRRAL